MINTKSFLFFLSAYLILFSYTYADLESLGGDDVNIGHYQQDTLFVSLGSYCAPASLIRSCGYRNAAFPFDWNILLDGEKLIEILNDGFTHFLNETYLVPFGWSTLLNTKYHLEFVHDGNWEAKDISTFMPILQSKYARRIERFKNLRNHKGKVFFIRAAYVNSVVDKNRFYKIADNIEITDEYAQRLHKALQTFFPDLNFTLIIINNHEQLNVIEEKRLNSSIIMYRASPHYIEPIMQTAYQDFFIHLLNNEN